MDVKILRWKSTDQIHRGKDPLHPHCVRKFNRGFRGTSGWVVFSQNAAPGYPPKPDETRVPGPGTWFDKYPGRAATQSGSAGRAQPGGACQIMQPAFTNT